MKKMLVLFTAFLMSFGFLFSSGYATSSIVQFTNFEGSWYSFLMGQEYNCSDVFVIYPDNGFGWNSTCNVNTYNLSAGDCDEACNNAYFYKYTDDQYGCGCNSPPSDSYSVCRNCDNVSLEVYQYWYENNTGTCTDVTNILNYFKNYNKSISLVSLDTDVCDITTTVTGVSTDYALRGNIPVTSIWSPSDYSCKDDVFLIIPEEITGWSNCNENTAKETCDASAYGCEECCNSGEGLGIYIEDKYSCGCNEPPIGELKKDRLIYYNQSRTDENNIYSIAGDILGLKTNFDTHLNKTEIIDRNKTKVSENTDTYVSNMEISNSYVKFYIANKNPKTIWVDKIIVKNHIKWSYLSGLQALYTTHNNKKIDVVATYDSSTDTITVTPLNPKEKIPIEPATGSNFLHIYGSALPAWIMSLIVTVISAGILLQLVGLMIGGEHTDPKSFINIFIGMVIVIVVAVAMIGMLI